MTSCFIGRTSVPAARAESAEYLLASRLRLNPLIFRRHSKTTCEVLPPPFSPNLCLYQKVRVTLPSFFLLAKSFSVLVHEPSCVPCLTVLVSRSLKWCQGPRCCMQGRGKFPSNCRPKPVPVFSFAAHPPRFWPGALGCVWSQGRRGGFSKCHCPSVNAVFHVSFRRRHKQTMTRVPNAAR